LAVANYESTHGHLPPAYLADEVGRPMHSWRVLILPFIEQDNLYKQYDFSEPWDGPNNRQLAERMPRIYALHGDYYPGLTTTNYLAVVGPKTAWPGSSTVLRSDVTDGTSKTILLIENRGQGVHWMEPRDLEFETMSFDLNSPNGISSKYDDPAVVMLDGSVQRLHKHLKPQTLRALLTINGGEKLRGGFGDEWEVLPDGRLREEAQPAPPETKVPN
jgi:hypothetical protein